MKWNNRRQRLYYKAFSLFCTLSLLLQSSRPPLIQVNAQEGDSVRSNRATQIVVPGPSNVRVNTWNGNLYYPVPLLSIPARGVPIELTLSYNSSWHDYATNFGNGWQLGYNIFYIRRENGDILVVWEDGSGDFYTNNNGIYIPPLDVYDSLIEYAPGQMLLRTKEGMEFVFDSPVHKRVTRIQDPNGNGLSFAYNEGLLLTQIEDDAGRQVRLDYENGNLAEITDTNTSPNRVILLEYQYNNLIRITDPLGSATGYGYDAEHRLTRISPPVGKPTIITYANNAVTQVKDELTSKSFSYDTTNRITTMTDVAPEGNQTTKIYYDLNGRFNKIQDPLGNETTFTWDDNNNLLSYTDALNRTTAYTYDTGGNLLSVKDPFNHTTSYTYEPVHNRLTSVTDARGNKTTYAYDSLGNLLSESDQLNHTTLYAYSDGDVVARRDANGKTTAYQYNSYGALIQVLDPSSNITSYTYDGVGNLTGMTNANADMLYTYDSLNRVKSTNVSSHSKAMAYTYDTFGNRTSMTDPDGGVTTYTYDTTNRLISLTNPLSQTTTFTYDSRGRLTRKNLANGTYALYSYDLANRLISLVNKKSNGTVISSYTYAYDAVGNRIKMTGAGGDVTTYTYDALNRLIKVVYPDATFQEFTYDSVGNRLSMKDASGTTNYAYDKANRLLIAGTATYSWDNNGNQISKTEGADITTYGYDFENRLTSIGLPGGSTNNFTYYPDGRRLSQTDSGGNTTLYFYDGSNAIIETGAGGATTARYTSGLGIDAWISMNRGGATSYYQQDGLGSITGLTSTTESVVASYLYDAFGVILIQSGSIANPYQFTGREYDSESGLYFYRARYYGARVGRFLQKDPWQGIVFAPSTLHKYVYGSNNPVRFVDPFGLYNIPGGVNPIPPYLDPSTYHRSLTGPASAFPPGFPPDDDSPGDPPGGGLLGAGDTGGGFGSGGGGSGSDGGSSGSGGDAGGESRPLDVVPSSFLGKQNKREVINPFDAVDPLVKLEDVFPDKGPKDTVPFPVKPQFPIGGSTNAVDAAAMDYKDISDGTVKGSIFVTKTEKSPYEHDYSVCSRFLNYSLQSMKVNPMSGIITEASISKPPWFWYTSMTRDELVEETFMFLVFVDDTGKKFTVDSIWLSDNYSPPAGLSYDYIFNFQIWAPNSWYAYNLFQTVLINLANFGSGWTIDFANTTEPASPSIVIKSAAVVWDEVHMTVQSWLTETQSVDFYGEYRAPDNSTTGIPFTYPISINPGMNTVILPLGVIIDAVVLVEANGFLDKVYVGTGFWFAFDDKKSPLDPPLPDDDCEPPDSFGEDALTISGCGQISETITSPSGYVGLGVTINPNGSPVDVSQHAALTFRARGDGRTYRLKIETDSVQDGDYHEIFVTPPDGEWRQFVIPLSEFEQRLGDNPVPFTGTDVKSIVWVAEGVSPTPSVDLKIDQVGFFSSVIISNVSGPASATNVSGNYPVTAQIVDDGSLVTKTLHYSVNGSATFTPLAMSALGGNIYKANIPAQPMGTDIRYYIEAIDNEGNRATYPPDAPWATRHFRVEACPSLLVDDFSDLSPPNVLRGDTGVTKSKGTGEDSFVNGEMCFDYDITASGGWVVYYSLLKRLDISSFRSVSFDIRGLNGGEIAKFGLNDGHGHEPKLEINEHLPGGITTEKQNVAIPLAAFGNEITDTTQMHSISLAFEDSIGSDQGTVCLDNIRFESYGAPLRLDNFNDRDYQNGVGLNHDVDVGGGGTLDVYHDSSNPYGGTGTSLALKYDVPENGFAAWHTDLENDLSSYESLSFAVRGETGGETFHIYLVDHQQPHAWVDNTDYTTVTDDWTQVEIPLQDFVVQGENPNDLDLLKFAFEWKEMSGTIYLDDIHFISKPGCSVSPPKVLAIERADPNPTSADSVDYTVIFSETVSGVDKDDFETFTTGRTWGEEVLEVNGSGNIYTVSVATGFGDGAIRLDLKSSGTGIQDLAGTPISGGFTSGEMYTIQKLPSVRSIEPADPNPTSESSVNFTVTFSSPVTGVDTGDFETFPTGGIWGEKVSGLSGSGDTYTVTVNTGFNNGTIRLDVVDDDSIVDGDSKPLGGRGAGNGDFTNGQTYAIENRPTTDKLESVAPQDGHIFELSENNNVGWRSNANSARFYVGDDSHNRQYLSILSFDTSSLPDDVLILSATLNVKRTRILGTNPFDTHGALGVEIGSPCFGSSCSLEVSDFQAGAQAVAGFLSSFSVDGWHSAPLDANVFPYIDLTGTTQFRLKFELEDNNNRDMDAIQFISGDASPADRPQLVITYTVP